MTTEIPALTTASLVEITDQKQRINYVYLIPLIPVIVLTVAANAVVVACVYCYRPLHRSNNYYVASLAVVDAVVGLIVMSGMLLNTIYGYWPLSGGFCTAWTGIDFSCCTISMLHLCLIAQDRHYALTKPNEYRSRDRTKMVTVMIVLAWVMGLIAWVPAVIVYTTNDFRVRHACLFIPDKLYVICQSCVIYLIPIVTMLCMYAQCVKGLRKHFRKIASIREEHTLTIRTKVRALVVANESTNENSTNSPVEDSSQRESNDVLSSKRPRRSNREHNRSVRTLGVVIGMFLFCWIPFCIMWPVQSFCGNCVPDGVFNFSYWATYVNSTINPLIYFACNRDFRLAFKSLLGITAPTV